MLIVKIYFDIDTVCRRTKDRSSIKITKENVESLQNCTFISFFKVKLHFFVEFFFFLYIFNEQVIIIRSDICNISMEFLGERKFVHH